MSDEFAPEPGWLALTAKQREVLDLLIEHKTSKEISRVLGISPHTVDQRIDTARARLGYASRGELANAYRRSGQAAAGISEGLTHELSHIPSRGISADSAVREPARNFGSRGASLLFGGDDPEGVADFRVGPELFEGHWGTLARLAAIFLIALLLLMAVLAGFSTYMAVSQSLMH